MITYQNKTNEQIENYIGVDKVFYTLLEDVINIVYTLNNNIKNMEVSMFYDN